MSKISELWDNKKARQFIILGLLGLVVIFIANSMTGDKKDKEYEKLQAPKREGSLLGVSASASQISQREASDMVSTLSRDYQSRELKLNARELEMQKTNDQLAAQQQALEGQVYEMRQQMIAITRQQSQPALAPTGGPNTRQTEVQGQPQQQRGTIMQPNQVVVDQNGNVVNTRQTQIITKAPNVGPGNVIRTVTQRNIREFRDGEVKERDVQISTINQRTQRPDSKATAGQVKAPLEKPEVEEPELFTLSMGSIVTGTLVNGVIAPTSVDRHSNPMPVLMRIKKEAIMPNYFTLDIRECHLLGSAVGDLSSSRAIVRAEGISCITNEGKSIEQNIDAYAVSSSDGLVGIEGEIIFKSGAMIANSLKAEFIRGFAEAFSPRQVQSLNTAPGASQLWQQQNLDKAAGAGIGQGFSAGASRIADYYMSMAEQTHPGVELLPGIEVDFIVQRGMTLKLGGSSNSDATSRKGDTNSSRLSNRNGE